jgi:dipeptidyl aminopeptidase/acylaminoacyl peptidase
MDKKIYFKNKKGNKLCGVLVSPDNKNHPIVILCHGFHSTKDNNTNTRLKELLKDKSIATFRFDFFGHGESEGKFEDITVSQAVEDLLSAIDLLKKKGYKKIGLIGASFGGLTALLAASKSKDLLFLGLKCPATNFLEIELIHRTKENLQEWKREGFSYYKNEEGETYRLNYKFLQDLKKNNGFVVADKIRIPTLLVHGDADDIVPVEQCESLYKVIPNCKLAIIPKADHRFLNPPATKKEKGGFDTMIDLLYTFVIENTK